MVNINHRDENGADTKFKKTLNMDGPKGPGPFLKMQKMIFCTCFACSLVCINRPLF